MCLLCVEWQNQRMTRAEVITAMKEQIATDPKTQEHLLELYEEVKGIESEGRVLHKKEEDNVSTEDT